MRLKGVFFRLKSPQNNNALVAAMVNYWNNLDCSTRFEPGLSKFIKLLKITLLQTFITQWPGMIMVKI